MEVVHSKFAQKRHISEYSAPPDYNYEYGRVLVPGEIGKVHFTVSDSTEKPFCSGHRKVPNPVTIINKSEGKRCIQVERSSQEYSNRLKRHFEVKEARITEPVNILPCCGWTRKGTVFRENQELASRSISSEYVLETDMNRKQRVETLSKQRNDIPSAKLGDKPYRIPDHESNYCSKGGLVAGSSIALRKSARPMMKSTLAMRDPAPARTTMTFADKVKSDLLKYEQTQILALTKESSKLGEVVPSWENRTTCYLVRPEDENY